MLKTTEFDVAEYLDTEELQKGYLELVAKDGTQAEVLKANIDVKRARKLAEKSNGNANDFVNIEETKWYKTTKKRITPAIVLKIRRENAELTQMQLAEKTGIKVSDIASIETGNRDIEAKTAKELAEVLECNANDFEK